jgi:hypothetical protein
MSFRAVREGVGCSPSMLAPARSRCRWVSFRDRLPGVSLGTGCSCFRDRLLLLVRDRLRRAGGALGTGRWEALGQKIGDRLPRERWVGWLLGFGSAGPCLRSQEGFGERGCYRAVREGVGCSPSMLAPARSRCRWVAFGHRLLLLVRDRLLGSVELIEGTGCWGL